MEGETRKSAGWLGMICVGGRNILFPHSKSRSEGRYSKIVGSASEARPSETEFSLPVDLLDLRHLLISAGVVAGVTVVICIARRHRSKRVEASVPETTVRTPESSSTTTGIRIVVVGERGTGKSTLIASVDRESQYDVRMLPYVPPVLEPVQLPEDMFQYRCDGPITVIDTSSSPGEKHIVLDELKRASVIVLTYEYPSLRDEVSTSWLDYLEDIQVTVPVIVAACKYDMRQQPFNMITVMSPIIVQYPQIDCYFECSSKDRYINEDIFRHAQRAVIYPSMPLYDCRTQCLKPECVRALTGVFYLSDSDRDCILSDEEYKRYKVRCFRKEMSEASMMAFRSVVSNTIHGGLWNNGLTIFGFLAHHEKSIKFDHPEETWTVLNAYNYNKDIKRGCDRILPEVKGSPDQGVELSSEALEYLTRIFSLFNTHDGVYYAHGPENVFSTPPESPWSEAPSVELNAHGRLTLNGFLSKWTLMTLLDPAIAVEHLKDMGYLGVPSSAVRVTANKRRHGRDDPSVKPLDKNCFQCFVFGPKGAGKSSLMHAFVGRRFSENHTSTNEEYFVNVVQFLNRTERFLIMREIPEAATRELLYHEDALAACDIAVFVYDSSNKDSFKKARGLLFQVDRHMKSTGYVVPCLIIASKSDLTHGPITKVASEWERMGMDAPIHVSTKTEDLNDVFNKVVSAAEKGEVKFPKIHRFHKRFVVVASVGAAAALVGLLYASRK